MSERPHCEKPSACEAKRPGKHCRMCANHAMHRNPEIQARRIANATAASRTPEQRALRRANAKARYADPAARAKTGDAIRRHLADPTARKQWIARAIANGRPSWPKTQTAEAAAKRAATLRAHHLAWCPKRYWGLNAKLKSSGFKLAERKEIILAQAEHDAPEAVQQREAREVISRITNEMHAKAAREKAMAY